MQEALLGLCHADCEPYAGVQYDENVTDDLLETVPPSSADEPARRGSTVMQTHGPGGRDQRAVENRRGAQGVGNP